MLHSRQIRTSVYALLVLFSSFPLESEPDQNSQRGVALGPCLHHRSGSTQLRKISMFHLVKTKKTSQRHIRT
ncbi:hypothetical protein BKA60DRAFT_169913 [Fusarium oxysporum]|nr:hypothetical protein BKA60DRAFT_169913 [Fusarium oxysporum]